MRDHGRSGPFPTLRRLILVTAVTLPIAAGCAHPHYVGPKTGVGAAAGAAGGGFLGATTYGGVEGLLGGALIGGLAGGAIGSVLDQRDRSGYGYHGGYGHGPRYERPYYGPARHGYGPKGKHWRKHHRHDDDWDDDD